MTVQITSCRYPQVEVHLSGRSRDPFFQMSRVRQALKSVGIPVETLNEFTSGFVSTPTEEAVLYLQNWVTLR